jgi:hypothetical protein
LDSGERREELGEEFEGLLANGGHFFRNSGLSTTAAMVSTVR